MASGGPTLDSSEDDGDPPWQERQPVRNGSTLVVYFPVPPAIECCELGCGATYNPATWTSRRQSLERHLEAEHGDQNYEHLLHLLVMRRRPGPKTNGPCNKCLATFPPSPLPSASGTSAKVPKVLPRKEGPSQPSTVALEGGGEAGQAKRRRRCSAPTAAHQRHRLYQPPPAGLARTCRHSGDTLSGGPLSLAEWRRLFTGRDGPAAAGPPLHPPKAPPAGPSPQEVLPTPCQAALRMRRAAQLTTRQHDRASPSDEYCSPAEGELPEQTAGRAIGSPPPPSPEAMTPRRVNRHSGSTYGTQEEMADTAGPEKAFPPGHRRDRIAVVAHRPAQLVLPGPAAAVRFCCPPDPPTWILPARVPRGVLEPGVPRSAPSGSPAPPLPQRPRRGIPVSPTAGPSSPASTASSSLGPAGSEALASSRPTIPVQPRQPMLDGDVLRIYLPAPAQLQCPVGDCSMKYNGAFWTCRVQSLRRHVEFEHGVRVSDRIYECSVCDSPLTSRPSYHHCLATATLVPSTETPRRRCGVCDATFTTKRGLANHLRCHVDQAVPSRATRERAPARRVHHVSTSLSDTSSSTSGSLSPPAAPRASRRLRGLSPSVDAPPVRPSLSPAARSGPLRPCRSANRLPSSTCRPAVRRRPWARPPSPVRRHHHLPQARPPPSSPCVTPEARLHLRRR
ncbi:hypothetical protein HPB51_028679 [Rhipicephalus microplus]|uniref:C2H2-type domain-containing protein n=1 Tax=Rhipicephalus microplus TaxID=6941 RepID=A0A9J6CWP2_RHIMP|nr:hypothetical protein HPB51_028679 [Rhipicephalus microplus]